MSHQDVIKSVSKKLKYYFEVKRLEDGFDLTGPDCPKLDHPPLKSRPTLMYDGLHDRPLKHYFSKEQVKQVLTQFKSKNGQSGREKQVRQVLERYMRKYHFRDSPLNTAYYKPGPKGSRRLRQDVQGFGVPLRKSKAAHRGGYPVLRSVPSQTLSHAEANRLVNAACKILLSTEIIDLDDDGKKKKNDKRPQSAPRSFESDKRDENKLPSVTEERNRPKTSRGRRDRESRRDRDKKIYTVARGNKKVFKTYSDEEEEDNDDDEGNNDDGDSDTDRKNGNYRDPYTIDGEAANKQEIKPWLRNEMNKNAQSDSDNFVRPASPPEESYSRNRPRSGVRLEPVVVPTREERSGSVDSNASLSSSDLTNQQTQTGGELLRHYEPSERILDSGKSTKYRIHVFTGDKIGAATNADIKIVLVGDQGRTKEMALKESRNHKVLFQKSQEDIFDIDSFNVGQLKKIYIGHDRKEMGTDWYLDRVQVKDTDLHKQYDIPCDTWLSFRNPDHKTFRDFEVRGSSNYQPEVEEKKNKTYHESVDTPVAIVRTTSRTDPAPESGSRVQPSAATRGTGTTTGTEYSTQRTRTPSETTSDTSSTYTTTTYSESNDGKRNKEVVSPRGPVVKRRDDFFDQQVHDKDYSSVIESLSGTADQDNGNDFDNDKPTYYAPKKHEDKELAVTPLRNESVDDDTARLDVPSDSEQGEAGKTPVIDTQIVHSTAKAGDLKLLKQYLEEKPDLKHSLDKHGWTLLHTTAAEGHTEVTQWLSVQVIDLEKGTPTGSTPMHFASMNGHLGCLRTLFSMGASVNVKDNSGQTPLHVAAQSGELEAVKYLVANRADLNTTDMSGATAADTAASSNNLGADKCHHYLKQCMQEELKPNSKLAEMRSAPHPPTTPKSDTAVSRPRPRSASSTGSSSSSYSSSSGSSTYSSSTAATSSRTESSRTNKNQMDPKEKKKHDDEIMEKKRMYEKQKAKMNSGQMSFMDSIRADANK